MKKQDIKIGECYLAKVSGQLVKVRIERERPLGGYVATNVATNRKIRIKTAGRLRVAIDDPVSREARESKGLIIFHGTEDGRSRVERMAQKLGMTVKTQAEVDSEARQKAAAERNAAKAEERAKRAKQLRGYAPPVRTNGEMKGTDAAHKVLAEAKKPMTCKDLVTEMEKQGIWAGTGSTPHATICSAILREMKKDGEDSRFEKAGKGKFAARKATKK